MALVAVMSGSDLDLGGRVELRLDPDGAAVIDGEDDAGRRTTLRLAPAGPAAILGLVVPPRRRPVDVSVQPLLVERAVPRPDDRLAVASWLAAWAASHQLWAPVDVARRGLLATTAGAVFPLLGAAIDHGAGPLPMVPRWAAPVLRQPDARSAALAAIGTQGRCSRRVVAALAGSFVGRENGPAGEANLYPLALMLLGAPVLDPDRLADVVDRAGQRRTAPELWPDTDDLRMGRTLVAHLPPARLARILVDAAELDDGPVLLVDTIRVMATVHRELPARLPNRLQALHDLCVERLPADPLRRPAQVEPLPLVAPRTRRREPARPAEQAAIGAPQPALAPVANRPRRPAPPPPPPPLADATPIPRSDLLLAAVDGRRIGDLRLVLPRTVGDLRRWGVLLHNCLASYDRLASEGRTRLIGVEVNDRLAACLEVTRGGVIRQFRSDRNGRPPAEQVRAVVDALVGAGVLRGDHPANREWMVAQ